MIDDYKNIEHKIKLIKAYLDEDLNKEQEEELSAWLNESKDNLDLFERIKKGQDIKDRLAIRKEISPDWDNLSSRIKTTRKTSIGSLILRYAAVAIILIGVGSGIFFITKEKQPVKIVRKTVIVPGSSKAVLTLAEGKRIALGTKDSKSILSSSGLSISDSLNELKYQSGSDINVNTKTKKFVPKYNTLTIPRGGEYKIMLEDGTKVLLNSDSKMVFPEAFGPDKRVIELTGEAYFQVTHDKSRPFIVKMYDMEVEVLGTSFNMRAYKEEGVFKTTLVEGKVKVSSKGLKKVIIPGQQAYISSDNNLKVKEVDINKEIAWTRGEFIFRNERLEDVLNTLSRWYDIEIFYQNNETRDFKFTGKLERFSNIEEALELIERMNVVKLDTKNRTVVVRKK